MPCGENTSRHLAHEGQVSRGDHAWEDSGGEWQGMKNTWHSIAMCQSGLRRVLSTKAKSVRWNRGEKKRKERKKNERKERKKGKGRKGRGGKMRRRPVALLPISGIR